MADAREVLLSPDELAAVGEDLAWHDAALKECHAKLKAHFRAAGVAQLNVAGYSVCTTQAVYDVTDPLLAAQALDDWIRSEPSREARCTALAAWLRRCRSDAYAALVGALPPPAKELLDALTAADEAGGLARRAARKPSLNVRATAPDPTRCVVLAPDEPKLPEWEGQDEAWDAVSYAETDDDHAVVHSGEAWERG